ncbi:hypothetical protein PMKS-001375 [Pichia membranifaciens]|uniref:Trafficking protein particle complex subunit 11 domain-containing protein n=1 Tax=Pichia membranifaciens TaxID=4926 RepID=A0A1Q2YEB9_9ASCO|nr:hypothetical protein PMKS-001375 [Pichia membranifaciens]
MVVSDSTFSEESIALTVGFYDPFSIFQGGFRSDFEEHVRIPSFYWKDNHDYLRVLKNIDFKFVEEIPRSKSSDVSYLKLMFVSCQTVDDYRAKVRPLVLQWLSSMKSMEPVVPYFIFFFENTELRTAADKYLKTNLFNKLKIDFDNNDFGVDNIFKIKSIYQTNVDKVEVWKYISASLRTLLAHSINSQLLSSESNLVKTAQIYQDLKQNQDALACYSKLFNKYPFIKKEDFESVGLQEIDEIFDPQNNTINYSSNSEFLSKSLYYRQQELILLVPHLTDMVYTKNICRLAQTLKSFINSLEMCYKRNEISFLLTKMFLNNQHLRKLLKQHKSTNDELINSIGSLKLLQRNELIALGTHKGYYVKGSMSVIDMQFSSAPYIIMDESLNLIMSSNKTFINKVIELTRDLISTYNQSSANINAIASLSTELALILYFSTDDYETSYDQLVKSYDFYFSSGWKYIGVTLLEVYIENLDKLIEQRGLDVVFQLLSSYVTLAVNKSAKFDENRFKKLCSKLEKPIALKTRELLRISHVSSVYCDKVDTYKIELKFKSKISSKVDKFRLFLRNTSNEIIQFTSSDVEIKEKNVLTLSCSKVIFDTFKATNISIIIGKFEILQPVSMTIHVSPVESFYALESKTMEENTKFSIKIPSVRYLHSDKLLFQVQVGKNDITNLEFVFVKTDPDKLVNNTECQMLLVDSTSSNDPNKPKDLDFTMKETDQKLVFSPKEPSILKCGSVISVYIPYFFPPDVSNTMLDVKYMIQFVSIDKLKGQFICSQKRFSQMQSSLPIAVAADETFRSSYSLAKVKSNEPLFSLFSCYTINSVSADNPIRIQEVSLPSAKSHIETWKSPKNVVAFIDQGTTFFYKVSDFTYRDVLLRIVYNSVKDEIVELMNLKFVKFMEENKSVPVEKKDLLIFASVAHQIWKILQYKLNFYALTGKIYIIDYNIQIIDSFLKYIDMESRAGFKQHITQFLNYLPNLEVDDGFKTMMLSNIKQELCITVSLPPINMINVVEYHFDKVLQYLVCEPINVNVTLDVHLLGHFESQEEMLDNATNIEKKVRFKHNSSEEKSNDEDPSEVVNLNLGFTDSDQKWIISGIKNLEARIDLNDTIKNNGSHFQFQLTFVPLKPGKLQLPGIEIKNQSRKDLIMELDYKNTAESVLVVSELNKIIHSF